ncbi:Vasoactive intestinal polypeptide receptor 2 [Channa argus]|uniref:Vasoactive intestinal polypeptide receptor 2 n=1 Tax=Channa argus TaxID=215402 RepID=A0A6G1Q8U6_CHAAH|nr:Vasoactive intestinal polypeptide receptor 2 [Channa argus]
MSQHRQQLHKSAEMVTSWQLLHRRRKRHNKKRRGTEICGLSLRSSVWSSSQYLSDTELLLCEILELAWAAFQACDECVAPASGLCRTCLYAHAGSRQMDVDSRHPTCNFMLEVEKDQAECLKVLREEEEETTGSYKEPGCKGVWDNIACWERAEIGETITIPCPRALKAVFGRNGNISRNCTSAGWSEIFPNITSVCGSDTSQDKLVFYLVVQTLYTLGHSLSLIALTTGSAILCLFRKLHCTRNYIHLNLFFSFILRAVAVLVKDDILFNRTSQCSNQPSLVGCKASLVFFQYFIMANFFWLLVEGLYLHTLLVVIFSENRHFIVYLFIGWGLPTVFVFAWVMMRIYLEDSGCFKCTLVEEAFKWKMEDVKNDSDVAVETSFHSIKVNFILFISIIRILVQKLSCPDVGGNDQSQYRRLAKSTLLLIPLFGIHYVVFVSLSESIAQDYKIFFDLALGSFQVQGELKRKWRSMCLNCRLSRDQHSNSNYASGNGSEHMVQFHRNSRTQSILQSETTVLHDVRVDLTSCKLRLRGLLALEVVNCPFSHL